MKYIHTNFTVEELAKYKKSCLQKARVKSLNFKARLVSNYHY